MTILINTLAYGQHSSPDDGMCLLEAASFVAGEKFSDHPQCVSPVLGSFGRAINDWMPDDQTRALLIPLIPRLLNTRNDSKDGRRGFMAADWAVRVVAPRALDAAGRTTDAATLRALPEIVDRQTAATAAAAAAAADAAYAAAAAAAAASYAADADAASYAADAASYAAAAAAYAISWPEVVEFFALLIEG